MFGLTIKAFHFGGLFLCSQTKYKSCRLLSMKAFIDVLKIINSPSYEPQYKGMSKDLQFLHGSQYLPNTFSEIKESIKSRLQWQKR